MKKHFLISLFSLLLLSACFKKEDPIELPAGTSTITSLFLGTEYEKELFFDLGTNTYQERQSADWDLRFDSKSEGFAVYLNNGNLITARKLDVFGMNEPKSIDTTYIHKQKELYDAPEGKVEDAALGNWKEYKDLSGKTGGIYVIELSYESGINRFKRLQIIEVNSINYKIVIADLYRLENGTLKAITVGDTQYINKDKDRNFTYFSFKNGGQIVLNPEPLKESWDIEFTRYKHIFYGILPGNEPFPYRVAGVLSNSNNVEIARDSTNSFSSINAGSIPNFHFSKNWNVIGYDWKTHAFAATGTYTVNPDLTYIIKDTEDHYYKLRFLDFYNSKAEKGYPKFEFERIK